MTEKTAMTRPPGWMDSKEMVHPALRILGWDDDRTDVHGIASIARGGMTTELKCYCGQTTDPRSTDREAFEALVEHALTAEGQPGCDCIGLLHVHVDEIDDTPAATFEDDETDEEI